MPRTKGTKEQTKIKLKQDKQDIKEQKPDAEIIDLARANKTSTKKLKKVSTAQYLNPETHEIETMQVMDFTIDGDFNYDKIWLAHLLDTLELLGNKKIKVICWLLEKRDKVSNLVIASQRAIAEEMGVSLPTVTSTLRELQKANIIVKVQDGVYRLSPDVIFKGKHETRMNVLYRYQTESNENKEPAKVDNIEDFIQDNLVAK
jgi:DNA-binding transcriptional ArsR family regulator